MGYTETCTNYMNSTGYVASFDILGLPGNYSSKQYSYPRNHITSFDVPRLPDI